MLHYFNLLLDRVKSKLYRKVLPLNSVQIFYFDTSKISSCSVKWSSR